MKNWSLRLKLTIWAAAVVSIAVSIFAAGVSWHLGKERLNSLDEELAGEADAFFKSLSSSHGVDWSNRHAVEDMIPSMRRRYLVEILQGNQVLHRSADFRGFSEDSNRLQPGIQTLLLGPNKLRLGVFVRDAVTLRLAASLNDIEEIKEDLEVSYLVALPLVLLAVVVGGFWISHEALAPIEVITATAEEITAQHLSQRLGVPRSKDEISRLTVVLNRMFDRLEASFNQAIRFTADASHELRTPLTIIRGEVEEALRSKQLASGDEKFLVGLLEEIGWLSSITEGLLLLSRADAGKLQFNSELINLSAFLDELIEDAEILSEPHAINISAKTSANVRIQADPPLLRQMLLNLLDNSIKYNEPGGSVGVSLAVTADQCVICVDNSGAGIAADQQTRIFDRFYRGDVARSDAKGHGLGLSISREIARAHGGELVLETSRPGFTRFRVTLPKDDRIVI